MVNNAQLKSFDSLIAELSRSKIKDSVIDDLVSNYPDKANEFVALLGKNDPSRDVAIEQILIRMPEQAIPALTTAITNDDHTLALAAESAMSKMGDDAVGAAINLIDDDNLRVSTAGANILRSTGYKAVPQLREHLCQENPSKRALAVLIELDPDAISSISELFENMLGTSDQTLSSYAITAAASAGDYALPILLNLLSDQDPFKQQNATNALIAMGEVVVPDLIDELDNPNPNVQQNVIRALREIGGPAVPHLNEALNSTSQLLKQNATAVLKTIKVKKKRFMFKK